MILFILTLGILLLAVDFHAVGFHVLELILPILLRILIPGIFLLVLLGLVFYAIGLHKKNFQAIKLGIEMFVGGIAVTPISLVNFFLQPQLSNLQPFWRSLAYWVSLIWQLLFLLLIGPRWIKKTERQF